MFRHHFGKRHILKRTLSLWEFRIVWKSGIKSFGKKKSMVSEEDLDAIAERMEAIGIRI